MIYLLQASRKALPSLPLELCSLATEGTQEGEGQGWVWTRLCRLHSKNFSIRGHLCRDIPVQG